MKRFHQVADVFDCIQYCAQDSIVVKNTTQKKKRRNIGKRTIGDCETASACALSFISAHKILPRPSVFNKIPLNGIVLAIMELGRRRQLVVASVPAVIVDGQELGCRNLRCVGRSISFDPFDGNSRLDWENRRRRCHTPGHTCRNWLL